MNKESLYSKLIEHGIKPSVQRIAIMEYLVTHCTHPSAEEVHNALIETIPTLSRTTVYNTLRLFVEQGAAQLLTINERKVCFDGDTTPHAHFICRCCERVYDLPLDTTLQLANVGGGHRIEETRLYFNGVCNKCLRDNESSMTN